MSGICSDDPADEVPARLLVADDNPEQRRAMVHLLRDAGYEVDEADDGNAVMLMLRGRSFDLVVLDLQMPGADGFDILNFMQQRLAELPVVLVSGLPPDQIQHAMHRAPGHSLPTLLLKPVDAGQLLNVVEMRLRGELPA
jgi:CheY-like chemotaxis protein